jgi:hypothetical protein
MGWLSDYLETQARENAKLTLAERVAKFVAANEAEGCEVVVTDEGDAKKLIVLDGGVVEAAVLMREGEVTRWL